MRLLFPTRVALLAIPVGIVSGLGAVIFRGLIALVHNLLFFGVVSVHYDATLHTPVSSWGPLVIFVPVVGAAAVAFLVQRFAPEAKGHGVPEVMEAIYYRKGAIRARVAVIKALASSLSIGSGGAVGREGPIIQIGAAFGSTIARILRMRVWQRITLIAAGAGGGIAATFNTPIGGFLFAMELILHEISVRTLVPVIVATATAAYVGQIFLGDHPSFFIPALEANRFELTAPSALISYAGLGLVVGIASALFIKSIYRFEDLFEQRVSRNYYVRHMLGMLLVGLLMYAMFVWTGRYYIEGVGYATIQDLLAGTLTSLGLLSLLFGAKLLATSLTLGSGASGGVFSPSLYLGATMGGAYAVLLNKVFPGLTLSPPAFALAGMAGMVGSATGAAMAGIVMTFEMTLDYNVIIPTTIAVAISYGVRKILSDESIYTLKLVRRGRRAPAAFQTNHLHFKPARAMMEVRTAVLAASDSVAHFAQLASEPGAPRYYVIVENGAIFGVLKRQSAFEALFERGKNAELRQIAQKNFAIVQETESFAQVLSRMRSAKARFIIVVDPSRSGVEAVKGVITSRQLLASMIENVELFDD